MIFDVSKLKWTRKPENCIISQEKIEIITQAHTDLWQRTYYHFRNDNAPVLQMATEEKYFSFVVKTEFASKHRFDQCGIVVYLDSENWIKGSVEYENTYRQIRICHLIEGKGKIQFGIYACSPEESSFVATFTNMEMMDCKWAAHDGQAPDEE